MFYDVILLILCECICSKYKFAHSPLVHKTREVMQVDVKPAGVGGGLASHLFFLFP